MDFRGRTICYLKGATIDASGWTFELHGVTVDGPFDREEWGNGVIMEDCPPFVVHEAPWSELPVNEAPLWTTVRVPHVSQVRCIMRPSGSVIPNTAIRSSAGPKSYLHEGKYDATLAATDDPHNPIFRMRWRSEAWRSYTSKGKRKPTLFSTNSTGYPGIDMSPRFIERLSTQRLEKLRGY
jgi:hypothetical protein